VGFGSPQYQSLGETILNNGNPNVLINNGNPDVLIRTGEV
jgi:hypothetical protein